MPLRILIVPDKFKGTLTAADAAAAIHQGWKEVRRDDHIEELPMADGGEGFGEMLGRLLNAEVKTCDMAVDSARRKRDAQWWLKRDTHTAVFETAQVNGLALLPPGKYHPFDLDTFGMGAVFKEIARTGVLRLYVGLGGSATNDGGFGLARSLHWSFWNGNTELESWTQLNELTHVKKPANELSFDELIIATDVDNPLLGPNGATRVYGPQKGLQDEVDLCKAEACLDRLAKIMATVKGKDFSLEEGAGAAGGLGFGLKAFCGGKFESGFDIFAHEYQLRKRIQAADWVITGEGKMDAQSLQGKVVGEVAKMAAAEGKRCICLAGIVSGELATPPWPAGFQAYAIVPSITSSRDESMTDAAGCLRRLAMAAAREVR